MRARTLLAASIASLAAVSWLPRVEAGSTPIAVSGFNRDMVVEATAVDDPTAHFTGYVDATMDRGTVVRDNTWYEAGLGGGGGLPTGGLFTSLADPNTQFQLASYSGPNALLLDAANTTGTLTLLNPGKFYSLSFLTSSGLGSATGPVLSLTLHFTDGSSLSGLSVVSPDWFDQSPAALIASGRVGVDTGIFDQVGSNNPRMYQQTVLLPGTAWDREVASIDLVWSANGMDNAHTGVFALSASVVPEPASVAMLATGAGLLGLTLLRRRALAGR
ncbi:MAG: PEP-CTERM sorting domain-containing protein [Isosphaeraceae bacterium]